MKLTTTILFAMITFAPPAVAGGFVGDLIKGRTGVDVERGEICAAFICVDKKGKTRTKSFDEVLDDQLNSVPGYSLLSESDKNNVKAAAKVGAIFSAATSLDPVTGGFVIKMIVGNQEQEVLVPSYNPKPSQTQIKYTMVAACLFQRTPTDISAGFGKDAPGDLAKVVPGDTISLTAEFCPGIGGTSVTSVTMIATSKATAIENNPKFSWVLLGKTP
jgi:hypothetical protein